MNAWRSNECMEEQCSGGRSVILHSRSLMCGQAPSLYVLWPED